MTLEEGIRGREREGMARRTLTIDSFPDGAFRHLDADAIVCIDVMLSTTTLVTAVTQGRRAWVAATEAAARDRAASLPDACLMGAAGAPRPSSFALADSPTALLREPVARPLVLWSPPGTDLITNASRCRNVLVASFRNLTATARRLAGCGRVALVGAGYREEFSCEDQMAAAWVGQRLARDGFEPANRRTAALLQRWSGIDPGLAGWGNSAEALRRAGAGEDLAFVLGHVDDVALACEVRSGEVVGATGRPPERAESPGAPTLAEGGRA
jgi:phosphosulfolactate phosphohydrolase-like enzyme